MDRDRPIEILLTVARELIESRVHRRARVRTRLIPLTEEEPVPLKLKSDKRRDAVYARRGLKHRTYSYFCEAIKADVNTSILVSTFLVIRNDAHVGKA